MCSPSSTHGRPAPYSGEPWGLDNGAYAAHLRDMRLDLGQFYEQAQEAVEVGGCRLAVLPDIVGGGMASLELSVRELDRLPELPWYLAVQDGMEFQPAWGQVCDVVEDDRIAGIFLGGTNRFKLTAQRWRHTADMMGKKLHYGRAGTPFKIQHAMRIEVDSLDSAFPLWTTERFRIFEKAIDGTLPQLSLPLEYGRVETLFLANPKRVRK